MNNLIHAVSRVRAREDRLLTSSHVSRMIESSSFSEAYSVLDDLGYAEEASRQRASGSFEEVLENSLYETIQIFSQFGLEEKLSVLTLLADVQNFKLAIKSFQKNEDKNEVQELLISYASFSPEDVLDIVFENKGNPEVCKIVSRAQEEKRNEKMENLLDSLFFERARIIAGKNTFLNLYIDFLEEGEIVKKDFFRLSSEDLLKKYASGKYAEIVKKGLEKKEETSHFSFVETLFDERNLLFLTQHARGEIDGYAPLFLFFWRQERNTRVIRSCLLAKRNNISAEKIRREYDTFVF